MSASKGPHRPTSLLGLSADQLAEIARRKLSCAQFRRASGLSPSAELARLGVDCHLQCRIVLLLRRRPRVIMSWWSRRTVAEPWQRTGERIEIETHLIPDLAPVLELAQRVAALAQADEKPVTSTGTR
jgi:hypothetical protein